MTETEWTHPYAHHEEHAPAPGEQSRGNSTAFPLNIKYRIESLGNIIHGDWLDYGCADGGYAEGFLDAGADHVIGVDIDPDRIEEAVNRRIPNARFFHTDGNVVSFDDGAFDGAFVNETMEHVYDERRSLHELHRLLKPGGLLVVISPNRWFPFECHTTRIGNWVHSPTPIIPWLPRRLTAKWVDARNYWPHELRHLIAVNGFTVVRVGYIWPVFESGQLPPKVTAWYQRHVWLFSHIPLIGRFGVSNLIVARRT